MAAHSHLHLEAVVPFADPPVLTIVHSQPFAARIREPTNGTIRDLSRCDASEHLIDVRFGGVSLAVLGAHLPDPIRRIDLVIAERLAGAARFGISLPSTLLRDVIAERGYEEFATGGVKNAVKRLRGCLKVAQPKCPTDWFIGRDLRGYFFNLRHLQLEVTHLPV